MADQTEQPQTSRTLNRLWEALDAGALSQVRRLVNALSPSELGELLESLPQARRQVVWNLAEPELEGETLVHVNDEVRGGLIEDMSSDELVEATTSLDIDDLADILEDLPDQVIRRLLEGMDRQDRERLARVLSYPEDSAGGLMDPDVVTVRPDVSLDVVLRYLRARGELPDLSDQLFVVNRNGKYLGSLRLVDLVTRDPALSVTEVVDKELRAIPVDASGADVAREFEHLDLVSAPVVDMDNNLVGRITIDDVVDFIREEAEHQELARAGLDEEGDMFAPVFQSAYRRTIWLAVNLLTAFLAAWVIGLFEDTLDQIVALAILMPVVASMGGIAGTQTLTLMVRGLATGQVTANNAVYMLRKELAVGVLNGMVWSLVVAIVAMVWFQDMMLGVVIAIAVALNLVVAAISGVVVPLTLRRLDIDPALAGGVVLTTVTDVMGFLAFLGLGTFILLR